MSIAENEAVIMGNQSNPDHSLWNPKEEDRRVAYQQLCTSYHAIDDFRAKLLGFLPLATGTGIFLLLNNLSSGTQGFLGPIGAFGFVITLGLFSYELFGIKKCAALIESGKQMEDGLHISGQFISRPREIARLINEPFAGGIIYSAVLAAWMYLALIFTWAPAAVTAAVIVFVMGLVGSLLYDRHLRKRRKRGTLETKPLPRDYDYLAPDGSEIRLLPKMRGGSLAHCILPAGKTSKAVSHRTVEELWFCLSGKGEIWRKNDNFEQPDQLSSGVSVTIPTGTHFQFRNTGDEPLCILITTMPPWPGPDEAVKVTGLW